VKGIRQWRTPL